MIRARGGDRIGAAVVLALLLLAVCPAFLPTAPAQDHPPLETEPEFWKFPESDREVETVERETQLSEHFYVLLGGVIFIIILIVVLIILYFWTALPLAAYLLRVVLPALGLGFLSMCLFAFLGWLAGGRLLVTQITAAAGAIIGVVLGFYTFHKKDAEVRPVHWSNYP